MDYNKIGKYILQKRKEKKLTQAKLAEKLFVSEKTISKWENGNGIPDTDLLPNLCKIFNITINELLNGEDIDTNNYENKAENKLLELQKSKQTRDKMLLISEIIICCFSLFCLFALIGAAYYIMVIGSHLLSAILIIIAVVICLAGGTWCLYIEQKAGYYNCKYCNHKYIPKFWHVFIAPHFGRTRYMKCPNCKKYSWHKKSIK